MKLYLSNAMRGLPELNFPWFIAAAAALRDQGHIVVSPVELDYGMDVTDWTWHDYIRRDIEALLDPELDGIALGPDWHHSKGANIEKTVVEALGLGVYYVAPDHTLLNTPQHRDDSMLDVTLRIVCDDKVPEGLLLWKLSGALVSVAELLPTVDSVRVLIHKEGYDND